MSSAAAIVEWERLHRSRDAGVDLAIEKQSTRATERAAAIEAHERKRAGH